MRRIRRTLIAASAVVLASVPPADARFPEPGRARTVGLIAEAVGKVVEGRVERFERIGRDRWRIAVGGCTVEVWLRTKTALGERPGPGPRRLEVLVGAPKC